MNPFRKILDWFTLGWKSESPTAGKTVEPPRMTNREVDEWIYSSSTGGISPYANVPAECRGILLHGTREMRLEAIERGRQSYAARQDAIDITPNKEPADFPYCQEPDKLQPPGTYNGMQLPKMREFK